MNRNALNLPKARNEEERQRNIRAATQISELKNPCVKASELCKLRVGWEWTGSYDIAERYFILYVFFKGTNFRNEQCGFCSKLESGEGNGHDKMC